jgi:molecular chaperone DnaK (HSP70)
MTDQSKPDPKEVISSFNQLIRNQRASQRVSWRPSSSPDPADQRADRDALNDALRRAGGHDPQHTDEPLAGTFPWKSNGVGDEEGST